VLGIDMWLLGFSVWFQGRCYVIVGVIWIVCRACYVVAMVFWWFLRRLYVVARVFRVVSKALL